MDTEQEDRYSPYTKRQCKVCNLPFRPNKEVVELMERERPMDTCYSCCERAQTNGDTDAVIYGQIWNDCLQALLIFEMEQELGIGWEEK